MQGCLGIRKLLSLKCPISSCPPLKPTPIQFDFGQNWQNFSANALTAERVRQARENFQELVAPLPVEGWTFLDIGFGQGLGLLTAAALGARSVGCDINPKCAQVLQTNLHHFPELIAAPPVVVGSILDNSTLAAIHREAQKIGGRESFEIVHSWGVLHHTGDMATAIRNASGLVAPGGHFILALYNRHWSSRAWWLVKWLYVHSPRWVQRALITLFYPVIYLAKWVVTGKNPKQQERGMNFYYDVIDWVGGYPYEYASREEVERTLAALGFRPVKFIAARVPTGCNEFVFERE